MAEKAEQKRYPARLCKLFRYVCGCVGDVGILFILGIFIGQRLGVGNSFKLQTICTVLGKEIAPEINGIVKISLHLLFAHAHGLYRL